MISMYGGARLVVDLFAGVLVDRYGERAMAAAGLAVMAMSSVLTGLAPTFALALVFRGGMGAGSAIAIAVAARRPETLRPHRTAPSTAPVCAVDGADLSWSGGRAAAVQVD